MYHVTSRLKWTTQVHVYFMNTQTCAPAPLGGDLTWCSLPLTSLNFYSHNKLQWTTREPSGSLPALTRPREGGSRDRKERTGRRRGQQAQRAGPPSLREPPRVPVPLWLQRKGSCAPLRETPGLRTNSCPPPVLLAPGRVVTCRPGKAPRPRLAQSGEQILNSIQGRTGRPGVPCQGRKSGPHCSTLRTGKTATSIRQGETAWAKKSA